MCPAREHSPEECATVLVVGSASPERDAIRAIFQESPWHVFYANGNVDAMNFLAAHPVHVIIANTEAGRADWRDLIAATAPLPKPPVFVVTARLANDHLWAEVLNHGGYDVLAQPFDAREVDRVIRSARRHYDPKLRRAAQGRSCASAAV